MSCIEEKILDYLTKSKKSATSLIENLNIDEDEIKLFNKSLKELEKNGLIFLDKNNDYMLFPKNNNLFQGKLKIDKNGHYFISQNNVCTYININYLNGSLPGDIVLVKRDEFEISKKTYGIVKKIISRSDKDLLFEVVNENGNLLLKPNNISLNYTFNIDLQNDLVEGSRVLVRFSENIKDDVLYGKVTKLVGHKDDPDIDVKTIALMNDIDIEFSSNAIDELKDIPSKVLEEELEGRIDLRDKVIFTIDGKNTKDIDDAISLEINEKGNYELGVHIADVSHYVKPSTALFKDAYRRATSVYLADSVIPMLPHQLSNGICSLNPLEDRLTKSCVIELDYNGNVVDYKIFDSVIRSSKKMNYDDVNDMLDNNNCHEDYKDFTWQLHTMKKLSDKLNVIKNNRGYLNFGDNDIKIETGANGEVTNIKLLSRGSSEEMIENFMLLANEMVATNYSTLPFVYRIHDKPNEDSMTVTFEYIKSINEKFNIPHNCTNVKVMQGILRKVSKLEEAPILFELILRGMRKAVYRPENIGHFGLSLDNYTHFTSPIRRFPDLLVHSLINLYNTDFDINLLEYLEKYLNDACMHSSAKEKIADKTEREVCKYKMAEFMTNNIGKEFEGRIIRITADKVVVMLQNHITGTININDFEAGSYKFNPAKNTLTNKINEYKVGDSLTLIVKSASKESGSIEFKSNSLVEKTKVKVYSNKNF